MIDGQFAPTHFCRSCWILCNDNSPIGVHCLHSYQTVYIVLTGRFPAKSDAVFFRQGRSIANSIFKFLLRFERTPAIPSCTFSLEASSRFSPLVSNSSCFRRIITACINPSKANRCSQQEKRYDKNILSLITPRPAFR
jgi:hypothetical protein